MPLISIVIPTCNRAHQIGALLDILEHEVTPLCEIIVVVQGTIPSTCHRPWVKLIHLKKPSLTKARNAGISASTGTIILFLDDDVVPANGLLDMHLLLHKEFSSHAVIAGRVLDAHNKGTLQHTVSFTTSKMVYKADYGRIDSSDIDGMPGCHMSFKHSILGHVRFDPWFRGNAHFEEIDVGMRIRKRGGLIRFDSRASLTHLLTPLGGCRSVAEKKRFLFDHHFNVSFCFAKNISLLHASTYCKKQYHDIEFETRSGRGHSKRLVFFSFLGLAVGLCAGILRRFYGSQKYR